MQKAKVKRQNPREIILILDNIRSAHNVGSIFRTADAAGVCKIYCIGTTPAPIDRFGRKRKDISKVSLGAEDTVPWEYVTGGDVDGNRDDLKLASKLKSKGFSVVALEQDERSVDYRSLNDWLGNSQKGKLDTEVGKVALILGNEVHGVSKCLLDAADVIMEIPMEGEKESLNVSVAAGIALFALR